MAAYNLSLDTLGTWDRGWGIFLCSWDTPGLQVLTGNSKNENYTLDLNLKVEKIISMK